MNKKIVIFLLSLASLLPLRLTSAVLAASDTDDIQKQLSDSTTSQLEKLNLDSLDALIAALSDNEKDIFGTGGFTDKVKLILSGEFRAGHDSVFSAILSLVFLEVAAFLPYLFSIVAVAVLGNLLTQMRAKSAAATDSLIHFVTFGTVVIIVFAVLTKLILLTKNTVASLSTQINLTFPVLFTLMTALGNVNSVAAYQPVVAFLATIITHLMTAVVLPIFIFSVVFSVVGSLSPAVKLTKMADFFGSLSKWILGITLTVFTAFMALQGISAATYDGISIRTAKYAISKYIPIVGGYLSEGFNLMLAGSMLIKNAVGVAGLLLAVAQVLAPVIKIAIFSLGLRLTGAILDPLEGGRISAFVTSVAKQTAGLSAIILSVGFMYMLTIILIVCTGNSVVLA